MNTKLSQQLTWFVLIALTVTTALGVVLMRQENREVFAELEKQRNQYDVMRLESVQLLTERSLFSANGRIDEIARTRLSMQAPASDAVVYVK